MTHTIQTSSPLRIVPVSDKADLAEFIRLPAAIFKDDPQWIPPLVS
jgi:hypothetical protein